MDTRPRPGHALCVAVALLAAAALACSSELPAPGDEPRGLPGGIADAHTVTAPDAVEADVPDDDTTDTDDQDQRDQQDQGDADTADTADTDDTADTADTAPPVYTSCDEVAAAFGSEASGVYTLTISAQSFEVWCDVSDPAQAWTLVASISVAGEGRGIGPWRPTNNPNYWEDFGSVLGGPIPDPMRNEDFRSPAFDLVPARQLRIDYNGAYLLHTGSCLGGVALSSIFRDRDWTCTGNEDSYANCSHVCDLAGHDATVSEPDVLLGGASANLLFLKAGEAPGVDQGYTDRTYLSTDLRTYPHYVGGLGAWCFDDCGGSPGAGDASLDTDSVTVPTSGGYWSLWVR